MNLRIFEIFQSLQGESTRAGQPCVFVRLAGCDVGCRYCDTPQARDPAAGRDLTLEAVCAEVERPGLPLVEITGGEPLLQRDAVGQLAARLLARGQTVMLETSGCLPVAGLDARLEIIMDVKTPASGAARPLCVENLPLLNGNDELKFVIADRADYDWSRRFVAEHDLARLRAVHFSPAWGFLEARRLAAWMHADAAVQSTDGRSTSRAPVRLAVQLHKLFGVP